MPKTLNRRYEELNAEIERLNILFAAADKEEDKAWVVCRRWERRAENLGDERNKCEEAIRLVVAEREKIVARLMKGKASKWLPPERAPVAYFEEA